jgi:restriction system protein
VSLAKFDSTSCEYSRYMTPSRRSRWNPPEPARISPEQYECQVVRWLERAGSRLKDFSVDHRRHLDGVSGDYEIDAVAELTILQGAEIKVIIECKRYSAPVEREKLLVLWAKLQDVNAHKAMMFSTSGFQSGALEYASVKGIATITFMDGKWAYETRSALSIAARKLPRGFPEYVGTFIRVREGLICGSMISDDHLGPLSDWLAEPG